MERHEWVFALTMSGVHGMAHLLKRLFPPLVPVWVVAFDYPLWKLGMVVGALTFGGAVGQAPVGHLSDRYDRRHLLAAGFALVALGVSLVALVPAVAPAGVAVEVHGVTVEARFALMLAAMFVAGVGGSSVHPTGYPLISSNVHSESKGRVLGMWGSASKVGDGLAPAFVGALLVVLVWNEILLVFGLLGLAYAAVLFGLLGRFETRPAAVASPDAGSERDESGLAALDGRAYRYPIAAVFVYFVVQIMTATGVLVFLPEFLTSVYGHTVTVARVTLTPESTASFSLAGLLVVSAAVQLGTGELADRYDERLVLLGYLGVATGALGVLSLTVLPPAGLLVVLLLLGASLFGVNPVRDTLVSSISPPELEGRTFGYIWTGALLASSVTPAVVGYIGDTAGLQRAFLALTGWVVLSAVPVLLLLSDRVYLPDRDRKRPARAGE